MTNNQAVALRTLELLRKNKMTAYQLENKALIPHSTLSNILNGKHKDVQLEVIYKLAFGFDMSYLEFLDSEVFRSVDILKELK
mgnify:CR=1 FL=1